MCKKTKYETLYGESDDVNVMMRCKNEAIRKFGCCCR